MTASPTTPVQLLPMTAVDKRLGNLLQVFFDCKGHTSYCQDAGHCFGYEDLEGKFGEWKRCFVVDKPLEMMVAVTAAALLGWGVLRLLGTDAPWWVGPLAGVVAFSAGFAFEPSTSGSYTGCDELAAMLPPRKESE